MVGNPSAVTFGVEAEASGGRRRVGLVVRDSDLEDARCVDAVGDRDRNSEVAPGAGDDGPVGRRRGVGEDPGEGERWARVGVLGGGLWTFWTEGRLTLGAEMSAYIDGVASASSASLFKSGDERVAIRSVGALNGVHPRCLSLGGLAPFWASATLLSVRRRPRPNNRRAPSPLLDSRRGRDLGALSVWSPSAARSLVERFVSPARSVSGRFRIF